MCISTRVVLAQRASHWAREALSEECLLECAHRAACEDDIFNRFDYYTLARDEELFA